MGAEADATKITPGDLPRAELVELAERALERAGRGACVYFKFTCSACGERCMFAEPNRTYERGECSKCGAETPFTHGGFLLAFGGALRDAK